MVGAEPVASERRGDVSRGLPVRLEGFDLTVALQRLNNDQDLFVRLLYCFMADFTDWESSFAAAMQARDASVAVRLAHTLKGTAANVGAVRVQAAAAALEAALRQGEMSPDGLLADCQVALRAALMALREILPDVEERLVPAAAEAGSVLDAIAEAEVLLRGHRLPPDALLQRLRAGLAGTRAEAIFASLQAQTDDFDFKSALASLAEIQETLNS